MGGDNYIQDENGFWPTCGEAYEWYRKELKQVTADFEALAIASKQTVANLQKKIEKLEDERADW